jgi:hypothetical protein
MLLPARAILALVPMAVLAWPAGAAASDRVISADRTATNLSAFGQGLAWSRETADGRSRLVLRGFGAPTDVPVPSVSASFDPDLGQDASGRSVLVYTRCAGLSARNCDLYEYDFERNKESKVKGASTSRCAEFAPSIWEGTIAFGRSGPRGCNGLYVKGERGSALRLDARVPADTDIRKGRVAYLYAPDSKRTYIRVFSIKQGRSESVIAGLHSGGERTRVTNPVFAGSYIYFLFQDLRRHEFKVGRSRGHRNSSLQFADRKLPGLVESIAVDGRTLYYSNRHGVFQATDPVPHFTARD